MGSCEKNNQEFFASSFKSFFNWKASVLGAHSNQRYLFSSSSSSSSWSWPLRGSVLFPSTFVHDFDLKLLLIKLRFFVLSLKPVDIH